MAKKLMKGNEAIGEAAIQAGCRKYFAYPITPQSEVAEYLSRRMPEVGGTFVQAESELGAANMVFGAGATGELVMTTSSSPGISLMSEALSYIAGAHVPAVFVNIVRGGPGLGGILPAQSDYHQATKASGHGDFRMLVLAPSSVQEAVDMVMLAFPLAHKYRAPVMVMGDGMIGQMMEPVEFKMPHWPTDLPPKETWATTGAKGRKANIVKSLFLDPEALEENNHVLAAKYERWKKEEVRFATYNCELDDTEPLDMLLVAYGTTARICQSAIDEINEQGFRVGLLRPITIFPFPTQQVAKMAARSKKIMAIEMSMGQMREDIQAIVGPDRHVGFFGRTGGVIPSPDEVAKAVLAELKAS